MRKLVETYLRPYPHCSIKRRRAKTYKRKEEKKAIRFTERRRGKSTFKFKKKKALLRRYCHQYFTISNRSYSSDPTKSPLPASCSVSFPPKSIQTPFKMLNSDIHYPRILAFLPKHIFQFLFSELI
jgi:hypothetical protein